MRYGLIICALWISLAWLIRPLAELPLWVDEGWSVIAVQQDSWGQTLDFVRADVHPPLYFAFLRLWMGLAGESIFALRLPSLFAALLSLALVHRLAREMFGQKTAFAALLILASSDLLFSLTPEVRHYVPYLFLASLSSWCLWRGWRIAFVLASIALIYTLYWGVFILIAQTLYLASQKGWQKWLLPYALIGLSYLPWLPSLWHQFFGVGTNTLESDGYSSAIPLGRFALDVTLFQLFGLPEALFLGLSLAGLVAWEKGKFLPAPSLFLGLWLFLPLGLAFGSAGAGYSLLTHRPMVALLPPMSILAAYTLSQMPTWAYQLLLGIILVNNLGSLGAEPPARAPWDELGQFLAANSSPNESLLLESDLNSYAMQAHTRLANAPIQQIIRTRQQREGFEGESDTLLRDMLQDRLWLVEYIRGKDLRPSLAAWGFVPTTPSLKLDFFLLDDILLTRFARPPAIPEDAPLFGGLLILAEADVFRWNEAWQVNLTWYPTQNLSQNYTVSVFVLGENGGLLAQHDSYPLDGQNPTMGWQANHPYFDRHSLAGVAGRIGLKVYLWQGDEIQVLLPKDHPTDFILLDG